MADIHLNGASIGHTLGEATWQAQLNLAAGANEFSFIALDESSNTSTPTTITITYDANYDFDGDGMKDIDEVRDFDAATEGTQNPFDPWNSDSTGDDGYQGSDGVPDGQNDWDGDGIPNKLELELGLNPMDATSNAKLPLGILCTTILLASMLCYRIFKQESQ